MMRPGSPENSFGTQNAGVFGTRYWWWPLFCYNFTFPMHPSSFLASLFSPFFLLFPPFPPSSLFCPFPPSLPFPPFLSPQEGAWYFKMIMHLWQKKLFPFYLTSIHFQRSTNLHITYTVVSVLGHGEFSRETLVAVNGICSPKILRKPSLLKRESFFRSTARPG